MSRLRRPSWQFRHMQVCRTPGHNHIHLQATIVILDLVISYSLGIRNSPLQAPTRIQLRKDLHSSCTNLIPEQSSIQALTNTTTLKPFGSPEVTLSLNPCHIRPVPEH